ncbi:MAG: ribonuclease III [Acidobacteriota bacterium]|nr:ribonuclease III [Acidobacteriota bacterium]
MTVSPTRSDFEVRLGHRFTDPERLQAALTHRSAAHEQRLERDYERLEFLGDAVLGLVTADLLYRSMPDQQEGELTRLKSRLVSATALVEYARYLGLGGYLILGQGEERSGGREKESLLADSMEAVFGAVFVDGGLEDARPVIEAFLEFHLVGAESVEEEDAKSALQEALQAEGRPVPIYRVERESGPDHAKTFEVEAVVEGVVVGRGRGSSKKVAERSAAAEALEERHREQS